MSRYDNRDGPDGKHPRSCYLDMDNSCLLCQPECGQSEAVCGIAPPLHGSSDGMSASGVLGSHWENNDTQRFELGTQSIMVNRERSEQHRGVSWPGDLH